MANANKSEVELTIGETTYTLKFGRNAMASVEGLFGGRSFGDIASEQSFSVLRAMFWASLQKHHPDIDLLATGDLMDEADDEALAAAIGKALELAVVKNGRPQKPGQGEAGTTT